MATSICFSKKRKDAVKTRGYVTISRETSGDAVKIPKGHIFKTIRDINGEELRYFALENTVLQQGALFCSSSAMTDAARSSMPLESIISGIVILTVTSCSTVVELFTRRSS